MVAVMVTRIHKHRKPRLYLREHRRHRNVSAAAMGERLEIERESVLRLERESWRVKYEDQVAYAHALGMDDPQELTRPPGTPSLDSLLAGQSTEVRDMAFDVVSRLVKRAN